MCLIVNGFLDRDVGVYKYKNIVNGNKEGEITYWYLYCNFNLMFKWQICYTEHTFFFIPQ
jgi:hypothetical protein